MRPRVRLRTPTRKPHLPPSRARNARACEGRRLVAGREPAQSADAWSWVSRTRKRRRSTAGLDSECQPLVVCGAGFLFWAIPKAERDIV